MSREGWTWDDVIDYFQTKRDSLEKSDTTRFKQRAYSVLISKIRQQFDPELKVNPKAVRTLDITKHMRDEILGLLKISKSTKKQQNSLKMQLMRIPGIGASTADNLIKTGLRSVEELRKPKWLSSLSDETRMHLEHTPEDRIPHNLIKEIEPILTGFDRENTILTGSFRRKMPFSRDIDVVVVSDDPNVLDHYLNYLRKHLDVWVYSKGRDKMSFIINTGRVSGNHEPHTYKLDVLRAGPEEKWSMILYLTGSKAFNIRMRSKAMRLGYLLNQNGLFDQGRRIPIDSEKGYFEILGMDWIPPEKRF